ncbi:MAG: glucokinase [Blastomonas sp.]
MNEPLEIVAADIGGTHARFSLARISDDGRIELAEPVKLATAAHASLQTALEAFAAHCDHPLPRDMAIAIAGPVTGDTIRMTNNSWVIHPADLDRSLGLDRHVLINDFAAVGHAIDRAGPDHFRHLAGPDTSLPPSGMISVVGPGTGLGVAALLRDGANSHVIATEGGHIDFAPHDALEDRLLDHLRQRHSRVSVERVVSGPGLRAILEVLCAMEGRAMPPGDDKALWTMALDRQDSLFTAALERFCLCLGSVAGDIALAHGPGSVVIAGGLGLRLADHLPRSGFAERFAAKGRYRSLMQSIIVKLITHSEPGLFGAAAAFARKHYS